MCVANDVSDLSEAMQIARMERTLATHPRLDQNSGLKSVSAAAANVSHHPKGDRLTSIQTEEQRCRRLAQACSPRHAAK
jgi:hypothetical protein